MEKFFRACLEIDGIEMMDLLMKRYHRIDFIDEMEVDMAIELIEEAVRKEREERIWQQWLIQLPLMAEGKLEHVPYKEYLELRTGKNIDMRSTEEIMEDIYSAHRKEGKDGT